MGSSPVYLLPTCFFAAPARLPGDVQAFSRVYRIGVPYPAAPRAYHTTSALLPCRYPLHHYASAQHRAHLRAVARPGWDLRHRLTHTHLYHSTTTPTALLRRAAFAITAPRSTASPCWNAPVRICHYHRHRPAPLPLPPTFMRRAYRTMCDARYRARLPRHCLPAACLVFLLRLPAAACLPRRWNRHVECVIPVCP